MENTEQITIVDLDLLRNIVNIAVTRGAFNAAEARQVGEIYEKLSKFLEAVIEQAKAQEKMNNLNEPVTDIIDGGELPPVPETPKGE